MSIAKPFGVTGYQKSSSVVARKRRISRWLTVSSVSNLEEGPSLAGWAVYAASALAFLMLCVMATFK